MNSLKNHISNQLFILRNFNKHWEITSNWQLLFPLFGMYGLLYSANKFVTLLGIKLLFFKIISTVVISYILLRGTLFLFKKLEICITSKVKYISWIMYKVMHEATF